MNKPGPEAAQFCKHATEFALIVRRAKYVIKHPRRQVDPEKDDDTKDSVVMNAVNKILRDKELLAAGSIVFEDHMPVRVGMRYMMGLLLQMTDWKLKDIPIQ